MSKASILIVEDNNIVMLELKDRLQEMGYTVVDTASSGHEAIAKTQKYRPDLTLMDIRLKGEMDGIDTAAKIKEEYDFAVVYLTAHTDESTLQRAKLTEPYGYIIKPFEERELRSTIEMAIYKHEMEQKVKESEKRMRILLKAVPDIVLRFKRNGVLFDYHIPEDDRLLENKGDLTGKSVHEVLERHLADEVIIYSEKAFETNEIQVFEYDLNNSSGIIYYEARLINFSQDEFILILKDITERKRSQIDLRELNASKDKFFSIIAHDLRSPFNSLLGFSSYLAAEIDTLPKEEAKMMSESIAKSVKSIFGLLENLLEWSRIKTGRMTCDLKEISVEEVVYKMTALFKNNLEGKCQSLSVNLTPGLMVLADRNMLEAILRNLISNAIKFTEALGQILITSSEEDNFVKISVIDNGVGMSEGTLSKLFKIDENVSTNGTQFEPGSGLGLILCKEFMELNHGRLSVKSEAGGGSTFSIRLLKCKIPEVKIN